MKFYVATAFANKEQQREVVLALQGLGPAWHQTYDWTLNEAYRDEEHRRELAEADIGGVLAADLLVVLLPGGAGTHAEMGVALGAREVRALGQMPDSPRVVLWSWDGSHFEASTAPPFYHAPGVERVTGPLSELVEYLR